MKKRSKTEIQKNTKKVKFDNNVVFIDVECWKQFNYEQTADENFDAYFMDYKNEDKETPNKDKKNNTDNKKNKEKRNNVSCTCNII